jgi:formylglycine-generating enzyme required for sulfatase activity
MAGNVSEWVKDAYDDTYNYAPTDGRSKYAFNPLKWVIRGGSWDDDASRLRVASRGWGGAGNRFGHTGFRTARSIP